MSWDDWMSATIYDLAEYPLPTVTEEDWRDFADSLTALPALSSFGIPDDANFDRWQDWAEQILTAVNGAIFDGLQ